MPKSSIPNSSAQSTQGQPHSSQSQSSFDLSESSDRKTQPQNQSSPKIKSQSKEAKFAKPYAQTDTADFLSYLQEIYWTLDKKIAALARKFLYQT